MNLRGKNIIVTGASSGIGLALIKALLREGCRVVAAARTINKISLSNPNLYLYPCDVSSSQGVDALFTFALDTLGNIDIFIANAGFAYYERLGKANWEHIDSIYHTNFHSVVYSAQKMKQINGKKPYNFLATASGMSILSLPGYALYSSSKAAIKSFAEAYRWELGSEQYFQVIYPIATRTEFFKNAGNSPMPWPSQHVDKVVKSILHGITRNQNSIYPSKLFYGMYVTNKFIPVIFKLYGYIQYRYFKKWLEH